MDTGADLAGSADGLGNGRAGEPGKVPTRNRRALDNGSRGNRAEVAEADAGDVGRMEVAGSEKGATWRTSDSLALRLLKAQQEVATLTQDAVIKGFSKKTQKEYTYKGITSAQIVQRAKEVLTRNGILYWPEVKSDGVKTDGNMTAVYLTGHFINVDDATQTLSFGAWGSDADDAGKGYMKALTNANKQVLAKALMMSTVEDEAEHDTQHEHVVKPRAVRDAEALSDVAIKTWADAFKSALDGCRSIKELAKVRAENSHMMKHPGVPDVTKDYFTDKIAALEGTLL